MMIYILVAAIFFSAGFYIGGAITAAKFDTLDWLCLRWNSDSFGYRPVPVGTTLHRGDKVIVALRVDSDLLGEKGTVYGEEPL